jgi:hypothetical protein
MGCLERVIEYKPKYDKSGVFSGKRRIDQKPKEAPGCSPVLVSEIIDHCVFVGLNDMGKVMPDYDEIPVPITPDPDMVELYTEAKQKLGQYLFQCRLEGDASALGMYLQTLLSWPSAPYRTEPCIHRKRLNRDSDDFIEIPVHTIPGLDEARLYAKEKWLIDIVRDELVQGRGVAVFCRQTGTRDIQPRISMLLKQHIPGAKPFTLKSSVCADQREEVLNHQVELGTNILICNPRLVQTGLDLLDFPTIVFYEVDYSLYVVGQASRRAWRLIQDRPCKTYYPYYEGLMENQAVELVGMKQQAAGLLYGEESGGLGTLKSGGGGSLLAELAAEMSADKTISDLGSLFAGHAQQSDPTESAWFSTEVLESDFVAPVELVLDAAPVELAIPVMIETTAEPSATDKTALILQPAKVKKMSKAKRSQLDGPSLLDLLTEMPAPRMILTERKVWTPIPEDTKQLALF